MSAKKMYNIRMVPEDLKLLDLVAKREGRSTADVIRWAARLYAMALLVRQSSYLKEESNQIMQERIGPEGADELRARVALDLEMFQEFAKSLDIPVTV